MTSTIEDWDPITVPSTLEDTTIMPSTIEDWDQIAVPSTLEDTLDQSYTSTEPLTKILFNPQSTRRVFTRGSGTS